LLWTILTQESLNTRRARSLQSATVLLGSSSTVSGSIQPSVSGANVTLIYIKPNGSSITRHIITEADGSYSDSYEPSQLGSWWIEASWDGDLGHHASRSQSIELSVIEPEPEAEESSEGGGIPGFPLEATAVGLMLGLGVYFLTRRR
jgi:hypothetical protein